MKRILLSIALGLGTAVWLSAEPSVPAGIPTDRYAPIAARAPFTLSSAVDPAAKGKWILAGVIDDPAAPLVVLLNRETQERMSVTKEPNSRGFSIDSLTCADNVLQSVARVRTPTETMTLRFDPAQIVVNNPAPTSGAPAKKPVIPFRRPVGAAVAPNPLTSNPS